MTRLSKNMLDYYMKGLPMDARQQIHQSLRNIGEACVELLLEYPDNYPAFRRMGFDDEEIRRFEQKIALRFAAVNQ